MTTITAASLSDVVAVLSDLRDADEAEYRASLGDLPKGRAASFLYAAKPFCWCARNKAGRPVSIFAAHMRLPHRWGLTLAATDEWRSVAVGVTEWVRREGFPKMWEAGCRRAEALMVDGHPTAGRWLEWLGATHEAEMPLAGINGETMHLYAFRTTDAKVQSILEKANVHVQFEPDHPGTGAAARSRRG